MSWTDIENALELVVVNKSDWVDDDGLSITPLIVKENQDDDRTENTTPRIELYQIPATTESMDKNANDEYSGIMQVSIFTELGIGKSLINTIKDQVVALFPHTTSITAGQCDVNIDAVSVASGRTDGKFWRLDCSVGWYSYIGR